MYYVSKKQAELLAIINKFGCIKTKQLEKISGYKNFESELLRIIKFRKEPIKFQNGTFFSFTQKTVNKRIIKAIDVYSYLNTVGEEKKVEWCELSQFPFTLTLFRNEMIYDIAAINQGEENSFSAAINRSAAEKVIVIVESPLQIEKLKITKEYRICIIQNDGSISFYEPPGGGE